MKKIAAVLSSSGNMIFVDVQEARLIGQFKGKHLVCGTIYCF
jgi:hypothetical protein